MGKPMGFIAAGGRSTRMGRDKAWLELGGRLMIDHVIAALQPATSEIAIIANHEDYKRLGYAVFPDTHTGIGPLEAIRTALVNSKTSEVILLGCDMPFVSTDLLLYLTQLAQKTPSEGGDEEDEAGRATLSPQAVVPLNEEAKPEPLCALYTAEALQQVTRLIDLGVRKVSFLFEGIPTRFVCFDEVKDLENSRFFFKNVNTPEDFALAQKIVATEFQSKTTI
jgi:molybdopterin-guanine dinucleotide biosynthesis protein A